MRGISDYQCGRRCAVYVSSPVSGIYGSKEISVKAHAGTGGGSSHVLSGHSAECFVRGRRAAALPAGGTRFQSPVYIDFFGIPIISVDYTGTVIPVILAVWFASRCEKLFNRIVPDLVKFFFVPMLTLLVTLPVAFLFLGPVATFGSTLISEVTLGIRSFSPVLAGAVVGLTWADSRYFRHALGIPSCVYQQCNDFGL